MKKKIVIITNYPVGYRDGLFSTLLKLFGKENIWFYFIAEKNNVRKKISIKKTESLFMENSKIFNYNEVIKAVKELIKFKPAKIIVGALPKYTILLAIASVLFGFEIYTWWGGNEMSEKNRSKIVVIYRKLISKFIAGGIFYSNFAQQQFTNNIKLLTKKIIIGNNTRDAQLFLKNYQQYIKPSEVNIFHICTIGFQEKRKNTITLLKAISKLKIKDKICIDVIGDGPVLKNLKIFAEKENLKANFYGFLKPMESYKILINTDLFVHCATMDQWPQVYNEALCFGKPILISNTSGVDDFYVKNNAQRVLFHPLSANELSNKILQIFNSSELQDHLRKEAKVVSKTDGIVAAKSLYNFLNE